MNHRSAAAFALFAAIIALSACSSEPTRKPTSVEPAPSASASAWQPVADGETLRFDIRGDLALIAQCSNEGLRLAATGESVTGKASMLQLTVNHFVHQLEPSGQSGIVAVLVPAEDPLIDRLATEKDEFRLCRYSGPVPCSRWPCVDGPAEQLPCA